MNAIMKFKSDAADKAERDLSRLLDQGAALAAEIEALNDKAADLEDVADLLNTQAAAQVARTRLRKLDMKIAEARERLAQAQAAAREKRRLDLHAAFAPEAKDFLIKARAAQEALMRLVETREKFRVEGYARDYDGAPIPPAIGGIVLPAPDLLAAFEAGLNRSPLAPTPRLPDPIRPPARPGLFGHDPNRPGAPRPPMPVARSPIREIAGEGDRLVTVLRNGLEIGDRQLRIGDIVAVSAERAEILAKNGAAEPYTPTPAPKIDAHPGTSANLQAAR